MFCVYISAERTQMFPQVLESANMGTGPGLMYYGAAYGAHLLKNLEIPRGVEYRKLRGVSGLAWAARRSFLNQIGTCFVYTT